MPNPDQIRELLRKIAQENPDFLDVDEPELVALNLFSGPSRTSSSSLSSTSTLINETFPPYSPVQLLTSRSLDQTVFFFTPVLRWLLPPPRYDPFTVLCSTNESNSINRPPSETQSEIEWIAETLFKHMNREMYNDPEFLQVLREWDKDNEEDPTKQRIDAEPTFKRKRQSYF